MATRKNFKWDKLVHKPLIISCLYTKKRQEIAEMIGVTLDQLENKMRHWKIRKTDLCSLKRIEPRFCRCGKIVRPRYSWIKHCSQRCAGKTRMEKLRLENKYPFSRIKQNQ